MAFKNVKKLTQNPKLTRNPISFQVEICYFKQFQGKQTPNLNSPSHIKLFDIKYNHFGAQNHHQ